MDRTKRKEEAVEIETMEDPESLGFPDHYKGQPMPPIILRCPSAKKPMLGLISFL